MIGRRAPRLEDGRLLRDAIQEQPEAFLGAEHLAAWGAEPALLVKLLDPDQRLPIHCHPNRQFAAKNLGLRFGKTEAWIVVSVRTRDPFVHLGFRRQMTRDQLATWVTEQQSDKLLGSVNRISVEPGASFLVPAGIPHAVGPGILAVELQEPTDLSILMEWKGLLDIDGMAEGHLGLGFARALDAVDLTAWDQRRLETLRGSSGYGSVFGAAAEPFFRAERIHGDVMLAPGFSILIVLDGEGALRSESAPVLELGKGDTILLPFAAGWCAVAGPLQLIRCLPPVSGS